MTEEPDPDPVSGAEDGESDPGEPDREEKRTDGGTGAASPAPIEGTEPVEDAGVVGDETDADAEEGEEDAEVEPVELLVQMAEDGEIEPWDIDIVEVTDAFLARLDDADLRTSGRALFYASVLLRMKSDALLEDDEPEEAEPDPWEEPWGPDADVPAAPDAAGPDPVDALEREMERRLDRKDARGTPETLDELVRELREAERGSWWKESRTYDTSGSPSGFQRGTQTLDYHSGDEFRMDEEPTADEALGTAHAEDIETVIGDVERTLGEQFDAGRDEVLFAEIESTGGSRVQTFLALLFLAHRGHVRLQQDELFGDLWVQDPRSTATPEEAVAD